MSGDGRWSSMIYRAVIRLVKSGARWPTHLSPSCAAVATSVRRPSPAAIRLFISSCVLSDRQRQRRREGERDESGALCCMVALKYERRVATYDAFIRSPATDAAAARDRIHSLFR